MYIHLKSHTWQLHSRAWHQLQKYKLPSPPNTFRITCSPEFKVHGCSFNTRVSLGGASLINKNSDSRVSDWPATCQRCSVHLSHVLFLPCITAAWRHSLKRDPPQHLTRRERREGEGVKSLWKKKQTCTRPSCHSSHNRDNCCGFLDEWQLRWTCTTGNQWHLCWN